MLLTMKYQK